jgi:hypothetical protein
VDDDDDGLVDCEDDDCTNGTCAPMPAGDGWNGPVAFLLEPGGSGLPDCSPLWSNSQDGMAGLNAPPASCEACGCGEPTFDCSVPTITTFTTPSCNPGTQEEFVTPPAFGVCDPFSPQDLDGFEAPAPNVVNLSCPAPSGGQPTIPNATWDEEARLCSGTTYGTGCGGDLCVPASTTFAVCVFQEGNEDCPEGYPDKTVIYTGLNDNRGCSNCDCSPPNSATCVGTTQLWVGEQNCPGTSDFSVTNDGSCVTVGRGGVVSSFEVTVAKNTGNCNTSGGEPIGQATPTGARTVCCMP